MPGVTIIGAVYPSVTTMPWPCLLLHSSLILILLLLILCPPVAVRTQPPTTIHPTMASWGSPCPPHCKCESRYHTWVQQPLKTLDCNNIGLHELPANISLDIEAIVLANNRLRPGQLWALHRLSNLTLIDLSNNHIYTLEDWWGLGITTIAHLAFDRNQIDYLPNRTFALLSALKTLTVSQNKIEIIHNDALCGLKSLQHLDLSHNRIFEVNPRWFRELRALEVLNLNDNNIHALRDGDFMYLTGLKSLIISNNRLKHVYDSAFISLENLQELHLENNHIRELPQQPWRIFSNISSINLSNNHLENLEAGMLRDINATTLLLNGMKDLQMINKHAISNMPLLRTLEIAENTHLIYIDRDAFVNLPQLQYFRLQSNNLTALERNVIDTLPALKEMSLYGNPFVCDCNVNWLREEMKTGSRNLTFTEAENVKCKSPAQLAGSSLMSENVNNIPDKCAPRILPLFPASMNTVLGDQVRLDCRAVGEPEPQIDWLMPAHNQEVGDQITLLKSGSFEDEAGRVVASKTGTLFIDYIQGADNGDYTCLASNPGGRDQRKMRLRVKNMRANVIIIRVTSDSVTVTWKSARFAHDYQILYRENHTNHTYKIIDIKPYMRSYTASELQPKTWYEFCIAVKHHDRSMRINCTLVSTRNSNFLELGVFTARDYIIGGAVGCVTALVLIVCVVTLAVKKYNRRRRQQEELYGDNLSQLFLASMDSMSDTTPITYENRAAEIFDDDDIEEIRSAAASARATTEVK